MSYNKLPAYGPFQFISYVETLTYKSIKLQTILVNCISSVPKNFLQLSNICNYQYYFTIKCWYMHFFGGVGVGGVNVGHLWIWNTESRSLTIRNLTNSRAKLLCSESYIIRVLGNGECKNTTMIYTIPNLGHKPIKNTTRRLGRKDVRFNFLRPFTTNLSLERWSISLFSQCRSDVNRECNIWVAHNSAHLHVLGICWSHTQGKRD